MTPAGPSSKTLATVGSTPSRRPVGSAVRGYHLMCEACNEQAVRRLRARKHCPDKPLAVLMPQTGPDGCDALTALVDPDPVERAAILDPARPIVPVRRRSDSLVGPLAAWAPSLAPGPDTLRVFVAYSPLHQQLLGDFGGPLVATSGNLGGAGRRVAR